MTTTTNARQQRNRAIKQRVTAAGLGVVLGAFGFVAATLPAGSNNSAPTADIAAGSGTSVTAPAPVSAAAPQPSQSVRRVRTRQS